MVFILVNFLNKLFDNLKLIMEKVQIFISKIPLINFKCLLNCDAELRIMAIMV